MGAAVEKWMKSRGQSTKPCGTPCDRGAVEEVQLLILMKCLVVRYDLNQERVVPVILRDDSGQERRGMWLMLSKVAVRLSRRTMLR